MSYKRTATTMAWMNKPWTCHKCGDSMKASGQGGHLRWCGKQAELFWSKVEKSEGCWLYRGAISFEGYGRFNTGGDRIRKQYQAHRYSWMLAGKTIPAGKCLLHKCDVRHCVNPDHLYIGTRKDNIHDAIRRGRYHHAYTPVEELLWPHLSRRNHAASNEGGKK